MSTIPITTITGGPDDSKHSGGLRDLVRVSGSDVVSVVAVAQIRGTPSPIPNHPSQRSSLGRLSLLHIHRMEIIDD